MADRAGTTALLPDPRPDEAIVLPSHDDPVVRGASNAAGGPVGRHARLGASRWWTPLRVLLALTLLTCVLGWWQKSTCRVHPWVNEYQYTRMCYTDVFALYFAERLDVGARPYLDHPVEYPVVIGGLMQVASVAVTPFDAEDRPARFFDLTALMLAGFAIVVTVSTARLAGRRRWDAAMVALAPGLLLHGYTNWDLAAVALAGTGMLAWARGRPGWAGVLLGLGVATKLYPLLFLAGLFLLCVRAGRLRPWLVTAAATVGTAALVTVPAYVLAPSFTAVDGTQTVVAPSAWQVLRSDGLGGALGALAPHREGGTNAVARFFDLNSKRPADWDSLWFALQQVTGKSLDGAVPAGSSPRLLNLAVALTFLMALSAIAILVLRAPRRPRVPQVLFLISVAFLLTNKVFSPQYVLWLVPLAVLARPSWRVFLVWQLTEAYLLFTRFYFFIGNDKPGEGLEVEWFLTAVVVRDLALLVLAGLVIRDILAPEGDAVRRDGVDDPAGGVLDHAPDAETAPRRSAAEPMPA